MSKILIAAVLLCATSCKTVYVHERVAPESAMLRYVNAVLAKDVDGVYRLLDRPLKAHYSQVQFRKLFMGNYRLIRLRALKLKAALVSRKHQTFVKITAGARQLRLLYQGRRWVFTVDPSIPEPDLTNARAVLQHIRQILLRGSPGDFDVLSGARLRERRRRAARKLAMLIAGYLRRKTLKSPLTIGSKTTQYLELRRVRGRYVITDFRLSH